MIGLRELRAADTSAWRNGADAARRLARELAHNGSELDRRAGALRAAWQGADADAAVRSLGSRSTALRETAGEYQRVDGVLTQLAAEIDAARQQAETAVASAPSVPGYVDDAGSVHVNPAALGPAPSAAAVSAAQQRARQLADMIGSALRRANMADQQAAQSLSGLGGGTTVPNNDFGRVPEAGTDPAAARSWWDGLTPEAREAALAADPHGVGRLDGLPADVRDRGNRIGLDGELGSAREAYAQSRERLDSLSPYHRGPGSQSLGSDWHEAADAVRGDQSRLSNLEEIQAQVLRTDLPETADKLYLLDYDAAGDGRLVASVGNPDLADNVVTYVPGMGSDLENSGGNLSRSMLMQSEASLADPSSRTASVMWMNYDAPDWLLPAASGSYAEAAAPGLTNFQHGLRVAHEGADPAHNVLLGHSYGSTTSGFAMSQADLQVDKAIFVGSPGVTVDSVDQLQGVDPDQVWAARSGDDIIRHTPNFIHNVAPVDPDFGAQVFPSDEGGGHSGYWDEGNQSRDHIADIIVDQEEQVPTAGGAGGSDGASLNFADEVDAVPQNSGASFMDQVDAVPSPAGAR